MEKPRMFQPPLHLLAPKKSLPKTHSQNRSRDPYTNPGIIGEVAPLLDQGGELEGRPIVKTADHELDFDGFFEDISTTVSSAPNDFHIFTSNVICIEEKESKIANDLTASNDISVLQERLTNMINLD
ncbi:Uncharacterized protein Fot_28784 [Forsythia ovata]|uniref:Uncharacterized protein n=1 Tax=Forsythia ovata TaxID=205694 RepID=A0ABD1TQ02_9LAMI